MPRIRYNYFSEIGPRDKNEDSIAFDEDKSIYVVCDGMGVMRVARLQVEQSLTQLSLSGRGT